MGFSLNSRVGIKSTTAHRLHAVVAAVEYVGNKYFIRGIIMKSNLIVATGNCEVLITAGENNNNSHTLLWSPFILTADDEKGKWKFARELKQQI